MKRTLVAMAACAATSWEAPGGGLAASFRLESGLHNGS